MSKESKHIRGSLKMTLKSGLQTGSKAKLEAKPVKKKSPASEPVNKTTHQAANKKDMDCLQSTFLVVLSLHS